MNVFIEKRRGYQEPWLRLPDDPKLLLSLSIELETELNSKKLDIPRKLEIYRMLLEINNRLKNYTEVIGWGEKYLKQDPEDKKTKQTELNLWKETIRNCELGRRTGTGITALGDTLSSVS